MADLSILDEKDRKRDKHLRTLLLRALHAARKYDQRGMKGDKLVGNVADVIEDAAEGFVGEDHALELLGDLVNRGKITEQDGRLNDSQHFRLRHLFYAITAVGSDWCEGRGPLDHSLDEHRLREGK